MARRVKEWWILGTREKGGSRFESPKQRKILRTPFMPSTPSPQGCWLGFNRDGNQNLDISRERGAHRGLAGTHRSVYWKLELLLVFAFLLFSLIPTRLNVPNLWFWTTLSCKRWLNNSESVYLALLLCLPTTGPHKVEWTLAQTRGCDSWLSCISNQRLGLNNESKHCLLGSQCRKRFRALFLTHHH